MVYVNIWNAGEKWVNCRPYIFQRHIRPQTRKKSSERAKSFMTLKLLFKEHVRCFLPRVCSTKCKHMYHKSSKM
jgi:hypothetical protein